MYLMSIVINAFLQPLRKDLCGCGERIIALRRLVPVVVIVVQFATLTTYKCMFTHTSNHKLSF